VAVSLLPSSAASGPEPVGPISTGIVPALADGFLSRTETAPRLPSALVPGAVIALVPEGTGLSGPRRQPYRLAGRAASAAREVDIGADWACVTGKTQLAVAYAEWLYRSGGSIIWVDAWTRASVLAGYASAVAALGIDAGQGADAVARRLVAVLEQRAQPWLLVLDGLRDPADVQGLIPSGPAGMTLITAADGSLIPEPAGAMIVTLGPFSPREAMSYVRGRLTSDLDQRAGMIDLVTEIGGDPGALAQACGVVQASQQSCREYAQRLKVRREQIANAAGAVPPVAAAAFSLAVERAHQLDGAAWPALTVAAMLGGQRVPWAVFASITVGRFVMGELHPEASAVAETLRLLDRLGLVCVDPEPDGPVVRVSQAVAAAVLAGLTRDDYDRVLAAAAAGLTEAWPGDEPSARLGCLLASCSVYLWRASGNLLWPSGSCPPLLQRTGAFLVSAGMLSAALPFWADLSAAAERLLPPDHPDRLEIAGKFAALLMAADEPVKASERYEWISDQLSRNPGGDHTAPIAAQLDLGKSLAAAGQHGEALTVLELAAADSERLLGPDHLDTVAATEDLAAACLQADDPGRAVALYQRALADRVRLQGAKHADAIAARHRLARAHLAAGETRAAVSEGRKVVADRERELGKDSIDTMAAVGDLGTALLAAGRFEQAVQLLEQAAAGYERIVGANHRDTLARRVDLARGYDAIGWIVDASVLLRETAESCERLLPAGDPLTAAARELLDGLPQH
jgi:tetratricopeptide (TPR) repeat protein